jgi:uncharacterized protein YrrD
VPCLKTGWVICGAGNPVFKKYARHFCDSDMRVRYNKTMLILKDRLQLMPVMSLQTGGRIAETAEFIIDPRQLKVVAFYCKGPRLDVNPAVLNVADIREIGNLGIIVDSADVLMSPDDLVRLKEVLNFKFTLDNKPVVDQSGHKLGHVFNFTLDSKSLYIVKLHVRPGIWQSFKTTELLIDRTEVIEVTDTEIVVKHTAIKAEEEKPAPAPMLENPFRRPQTEGNSHAIDEKLS